MKLTIQLKESKKAKQNDAIFVFLTTYLLISHKTFLI